MVQLKLKSILEKASYDQTVWKFLCSFDIEFSNYKCEFGSARKHYQLVLT